MADTELAELVQQAFVGDSSRVSVSAPALRRLLRENREVVLRELGGEQVGKTTAFFEPADDMWLFPCGTCPDGQTHAEVMFAIDNDGDQG